jgi:MFS family permease
MLMATTVNGLVDLSIWRIVTGLGIGGMLAAINAVAAEFSNTQRRHLSVSLMSIGYPAGAVVGGIVAAQLLQATTGGRSSTSAPAITAVLIPVTYFRLPESVHWLARKQPPGALEKINRAMARMGHPAATTLPVVDAGSAALGRRHLRAPGSWP